MLVDCCQHDVHVSEIQDWFLDLAIENSLLTLDRTEFRKSCQNFLLGGPSSIDETETNPIEKDVKSDGEGRSIECIWWEAGVYLCEPDVGLWVLSHDCFTLKT